MVKFVYIMIKFVVLPLIYIDFNFKNILCPNWIISYYLQDKTEY